MFSDVLSSKDGHIHGERRKNNDPQTVRFIITNNDIVYADKWPLPRYGPRAFYLALNEVMKDYYGY